MHKLLTTIFLFYFLFSQSQVMFAQNQLLLDSLLSVKEEAFSSANNRVQHHIKIANLYYGINPNKMLEQAKIALKIAQNVDYQQGEGDANRFCGIAFFTLGDFKEAENYFSKALTIYQNIDNSKGIISSLSNLGSVNMVQNKYAEALRYYQYSLKNSSDAKDFLNMGITYGNIGVIYSELKKYEQALEHFQGGLTLHTRIDYGIGIATGLGNVGNVYFKTKDFAKAQSYYQQALDKNLSLSNSLGVAREYGNLGNTLLELGKTDEAYQSFEKALKINQNLKNKKGEAVNLQGIGNYFLRINDLNKALEVSKKANELAKEINIQDVSMETYNNLSQIYEKMGDMIAAYENYKQYVTVKEAIDNENNRKQITRLEIQYDFDAKEEKYKTEQALSEERLIQQRLQLQLNQSKLNESNKERDIARLSFLQSQSALQTEQFERNAKAKQLEISEKERAFQSQKNKTLEQEQVLNQLKINQLWLYGFLVIVGLLLLGSILLGYFRAKSMSAENDLIIQKNEQLQAELQLKNEVKEAEMQVFRAQMNPHFIFNSLNSINSFILENQADLASEYLTTFSKLLRNILDNSQHKLISLDNELKTLRWYIELEALRLEQKFAFEFQIDPELDTAHIKIPPLLLQPFVENAIWHGLRQKKDKGLLIITLEPILEDKISIKIIDNGIGRAAAKKHQTKEHQSHGINITINRLELLNPQNEVNIVDLYDEQSHSNGTKVEIFYNI